MGRLRSQVNRLSRNDKHLQKYDAVIQDQVQKGIVEVFRDEDCKNTLKHYIPHHEILTPEKTTTKLRVVFDASAKTRKKNQSLNESLHRGPVILEDLCGLLLRFRPHKVALVPDVEKGFLQVGLQPDDRDVTRFLWLKDPLKPTAENNVQILRFTRVPFGMISSPFLLAATTKNHLTKAGTPIAHQIADNMYVDNMITGVETSTQADELYEEAKTLFQSASMDLREWASNSSEFLQNTPECDRTSAETVKVLGTYWNLTTDTIFINRSHNLSSNVNTKREALQSVSRIYDPLGLFSLATLNAKLLIQELWKQEKHWDETFSRSSQQEWNKIYESLTPLSSQPLPRYVGGDEHKLFCFTDASAKAYSAAVYLYSSVNGKATANLVFSKALVAPAKQLSIPRLELLAVRAIHLEVVHDMTAEQFLFCLRRFIATRGKPRQIISDNASQFKVVKSTVEEAWQLSMTSPDTQSYLANEGIKWSFTIELAPWMGGFYERLIGLVKQSLRKSIGKICLTIVQLETVVKEVKAVINSRPLVYVRADFSSGFTLTPGDFLSLNPKTGVPSLAEEDRQQDPDFLSKLSSSQKLLDMWRKGQKHLDTFRNLLFNEYALSLREQTQNHLKKLPGHNPQPNPLKETLYFSRKTRHEVPGS
ncbi:hypothetical protein AWC38_SpisGene15123 [Stylophora pistillata]|uniref:Integrase catalytic domain-containing protein n=1 Tax=Stylophora pistillata TaxID=50429 RepID=A0A2B4RW37_STYPI|nr:hypothetical protein AWC38_SpisGene15123 [Stylophora pistillata]